MTLKSVIRVCAPIAAFAGFVLLISAGAPAVRAAGPQIPDAVRARSQRGERVRVVVELKLQSSLLPEASLRTAAAVTAQRREIAARADRVLSRLSAGAGRIRRYQTVPYLALEVTPTGLAALEAP